MKKIHSTSVVFLVAALLFIVMFMNTWMVFTQNREQTREAGSNQLAAISGELENTISKAENLTLEVALSVQEHAADRNELEAFLYEKKADILSRNSGAYNAYIGGPGWIITPDFTVPDDFVTTERIWYTGALRSNGRTYVSAPYQDVLTGYICYTVSVLLGDGETVLGIDYTIDTIQTHIREMFTSGTGNATIVTDEGIIAGCSDESLIGKNLLTALPEYAGIYSLAKNREGVVTARIKAKFLYENLFAAKSGNGWYLIVSESDWGLYRNSYIQLLFTLFLSLSLFAFIVILYLRAVNNRKKAEDALASKDEFLSSITGELKIPLRQILERSDSKNTANIEDFAQTFGTIHASGKKLSETIEQIISYSTIVRAEKKQEPELIKTGANKRFRTVIIVFMGFVMLISLYTNLSATFRWGNVLMKSDAERYEYELSEWINTQKSILDMFVSIISTNPEILDDYESSIAFLNRITMQFPEISVTYMASPELEPTVYMNNGWKPEANWKVEERQWYLDTMASSSGWSISAPYYDEQTGGYCVTFSEKVYDYQTGKFLGNFGIDFFMDKLVEILGDSYSETGYAFLVDPEGDIINHPYGSYQMSQDHKTNVSELSYGSIEVDGVSTKIVRDYDSSYRIFIAAGNSVSRFMVYVASNIWRIYGRVVIYGSICLLTFLICIIQVYRLLTDLIRWQDETNRQMREAADAAIAAGNAKSQFLAQMSHEIRTPLNAVLGMNELIRLEAKDQNIIEYSDNIQVSGKMLLSLINTILDFSRIEEGRMEIIPVRYNLATLVSNLVNATSERAKDKSLEFIVDMDDNLPSELLGDDLRIEQIIMNLLTNAVKYTDEGSVTLSIQESSRQDDEIVLDIAVKDTGIGIRSEDMDRLFETFERLDEKRNRNIEGTGLGMPIVAKLLEMMGSEIHVESVYGVGSVFSFQLKQTIVNVKPIREVSASVSKNAAKVHQSLLLYAPDAKVLVVDDNEMNLKVCRGLMKRFGISPDFASSGSEAIEMIKSRHYDIVFLDHMMPNMDGVETLKRLQEEDIPLPPVVALTANAVAGAREMYLSAGFDDYLSKPIELNSLQIVLNSYLPEALVSFHLADDEGTKWKIYGTGFDDEPEIMEFPAVEPSGVSSSGNVVVGDDTVEQKLQKLQSAGLNIDDGLHYCGGDKLFYLTMVSDYADEADERCRKLDGIFRNGIWHEYKIAVHGLKSSSATIGADRVSVLARDLEQAADQNDAHFIRAHHEELMEEYQKLTEAAAKIVSGD